MVDATNKSCYGSTRSTRRGVGELGRLRWTHAPEIAGSNPATATILADIAIRIRDIALGDDRAHFLDILPMTEARGFLNI